MCNSNHDIYNRIIHEKCYYSEIYLIPPLYLDNIMQSIHQKSNHLLLFLSIFKHIFHQLGKMNYETYFKLHFPLQVNLGTSKSQNGVGREKIPLSEYLPKEIHFLCNT